MLQWRLRRRTVLGFCTRHSREVQTGSAAAYKIEATMTVHGGGGGDIGKTTSHGGGDWVDDDDYFDEFDEGDDGDEGGSLRRTIFQEVFDRKSVEAVLREWHKTKSDLSAGLLQACEMGLVNTAQMVGYLSINARPTVSRFISCAIHQAISRAFMGRSNFSLQSGLRTRYNHMLHCLVRICHQKERIKQEWDLALIKVLAVSICNAAIVWNFAPCFSYGNSFRFCLENSLQKLPNNVFERSYLLREVDLQKRIHCFFYKAAELCAVGMAAGADNSALSKLLTS